MPERRPQQRARAAVVPFPAGTDRAAFVRLLPSGRSLLIGFALVAAAAGLYTLARVTPMFAVQQIEVEGAPPAVAAHVRAALAPLEGTSLLALHRADVERRLTPLTDVATASYDRSFPHTLRVVVRAEDPVAVARRGANAWLVSGAGRVMAPAAAGTHRSLPRIWLTQSGDPQLGAALVDRAGLRAVQALAIVRSSRFRIRVWNAKAQPHELTFLLGSGLQLRLGDLRAIPLKLAVATSVLPRLRGGGYTYLDVSVPGRPVAGTNSQPAG
ncbi:MAG: cell division protein FtsQ/DivIB [Gaiellaceae bacterium]